MLARGDRKRRADGPSRCSAGRCCSDFSDFRGVAAGSGGALARLTRPYFGPFAAGGHPVLAPAVVGTIHFPALMDPCRGFYSPIDMPLRQLPCLGLPFWACLAVRPKVLSQMLLGRGPRLSQPYLPRGARVLVSTVPSGWPTFCTGSYPTRESGSKCLRATIAICFPIPSHPIPSRPIRP